MEEEATGQAVAEPEAPPGDAGATASAEPIAEASALIGIDTTQLPNFEDEAATEAWIAASTAAANAQAEVEMREAQADNEAATAAAIAPDAGNVTPPPGEAIADAALDVGKASEPDYEKIAAEMAAKGYKVEPPAPPPDPAQAINDRMVQFAGTSEEYAAARAAADAPIPPKPDDTDPQWQAKYDAMVEAIGKRDAALAEVKRMDIGRTAAAIAPEWGWQRAMGRLGQSWAALPETYGLTPERAKRVTEPANATDAVAAVVEQVSANYDAKIAAIEKHWKGEVARAKSDGRLGSVRAMGAAPQPGAASSGRPAVAAAAWGNTPIPDEAWIQKAIAGDFGNVDLSDR